MPMMKIVIPRKVSRNETSYDYLLRNTLLGPPAAYNANAALLFCCCFFLSFFFLQREISAVSRPIAAKLCHVIGGNGCSFKNNYVQSLGVLPQKIWGRKTCFFGAILDDFALPSRISPERNKLSSIGKRRCKLRSLTRLLT